MGGPDTDKDTGRDVGKNIDKTTGKTTDLRAVAERELSGALGAGLELGDWGLRLGALQIGLAASAADMADVARLRAVRFRGTGTASDLDRFDPLSRHLVIRSGPAAPVQATARLRLLSDPSALGGCYTAQFYDLGALARLAPRCLEIGRICIDARLVHDPDILRALLAGLTRLALDQRAEFLIGCASFRGADPARHHAALALLSRCHLGPEALRPARRPDRLSCALPAADPPDRAAALRSVPALLRLYLRLGGWVSDHAVLDPELDTLHVFAAVETRAVPPHRLRALDLLARP